MKSTANDMKRAVTNAMNAAYSPGNLDAQEAMLRAATELERQLGALSDALRDKQNRNAVDAAKSIAQLIDTMKQTAPRVDEPIKRKKLTNTADELENLQGSRLVPGVKVSGHFFIRTMRMNSVTQKSFILVA